MTITKFNSAIPSGFSFTQEITTGVHGWWVTISGNDFRLYDGDYTIADDAGVFTYYCSASDYSTNAQCKRTIREALGKQAQRDTIDWVTNTANVPSGANRISIGTTIHLTLTLLGAGAVQDGRDLLNSLTVSAPFTNAVKTALLAIADAAVAKL